ncbi:TPA: hypothetical protein R1915_001868, partial [Staphylococcus delphini]|nr:hypothetical protein [Staphylococcus delphini]
MNELALYQIMNQSRCLGVLYERTCLFCIVNVEAGFRIDALYEITRVSAFEMLMQDSRMDETPEGSAEPENPQ